MTTYHSPLWLIDWDYEESDEVNAIDDIRDRYGKCPPADIAVLLAKIDALEADERRDCATIKDLRVEKDEEIAALGRELDAAWGECERLTASRDRWQSRAKWLLEQALHYRAHEAASSITYRLFAAECRRLRKRISMQPAIADVPADEREARHEPPFAVLPELY